MIILTLSGLFKYYKRKVFINKKYFKYNKGLKIFGRIIKFL